MTVLSKAIVLSDNLNYFQLLQLRIKRCYIV